MRPAPHAPTPARFPLPRRPRSGSRQRGVAAIIAMMFLVIFGSLAAAMAIVSQGGLRSAESHLKVNRSHAAAETGLDLLEWRMEQAMAGRTNDPALDASLSLTPVRSDQGVVTPALAVGFWNQTAWNLNQILGATGSLGVNHNQRGLRLEPQASGSLSQKLSLGPIRVGPGQPDFEAVLQPHPLPGEDYTSARYDRLPYGPPAGKPDGTALEKAAWARDVKLKREAGIDFVVGSPTEAGRVAGFEYRPLDARFIRVSVTGTDRGTFNASADGAARAVSREGAAHSVIRRTVEQDYLLTKTIPFALLARSRVMIGRNVTIDGPVNSRFSDVKHKHGHPIQMESDFFNLLGTGSNGLNNDLNGFVSTLSSNGSGVDLDGDNRINLASPSETAGLIDPRDSDFDGDGYLSEFDWFVKAFDGRSGGVVDGRISPDELGIDASSPDQTLQQLFTLIDADASPNVTYGPDGQPIGDGFLDADDEYAKVRGQLIMEATLEDWEEVAAESGNYRDYLKGPVTADFGKRPLVAGEEATDDAYDFSANSFDMTAYSDRATNTLNPASAGSATANDTSEPVEFNGRNTDADGNPIFEKVPYQSEYAYDHFDRPVYRNLRFSDIRIPPGTNALFENCRFIGVTYIETAANNMDPNFNYAGIQDKDGVPTYWDRPVEIDGVKYGGLRPTDPGYDPADNATGTKMLSNNIRFHNCTFEGPVTGGPVGGGRFPANFQFTHTRNKVTFTGRTRWEHDANNGKSDADKAFYRRSSILMPHFSVELGSFKDPASLTEEVDLEGTVVAGIIDIRGQADVHGTVVTTFEPESDTGPVIGNTSPNFNTTLGYFDNADGDREGERPDNGVGRIRLRYNAVATLPDGIESPITLVPLHRTYAE
ncbi:hypothetical protein [Phycisphaera mikurensis]|uniref:Uncharacterized protein n=1 Tax=Phycisphaera mikurensis (strain NBRC 102666 / KCTC 22515 / FYK2301M01) TaxID=1142394 RepID=I0IB30_PHYMF|nr:hypothetical protein [Phycisphaera mikurensis]MBB6442561.1 hypothetical protein [Phycisphaera mikurensis]BAM02468.1 hypothetical protein PSMK_03090 [Phycisphaera mikurensis NBRC 102666]